MPRKVSDRVIPRNRVMHPPASNFGVLFESSDKLAGTILVAENEDELRLLVRQHRHNLTGFREPFVPTPKTAVLRMLRLAKLKPGETLYDLGCGDGRIPINAARYFGAKAIGVELRKDLVAEARRKVAEMHLEDAVKILRQDFMRVSLSRADALALYLRSNTLSELIPKFERELQRGARIVTYQFPIRGWNPEKKARLFEREIHLFGREKYIDRRLEREIYLYRV